jgi:hypothetical protein
VVTVVKPEPSLFTYLACMGLAMIGYAIYIYI